MRKLTHKLFISRLKTIHKDSITALTLYVDSRTPVTAKCKVCEHEWSTVSLLKRKKIGCPLCGKLKAAKTIKWPNAGKELTHKIPKTLHVDIISTYTNVHAPIKVRCLSCEREWISKPKYLLKGYGCGPCSRRNKGIKSRITHEVFCSRIKDEHEGKISVLGTYTTGKSQIKAECISCGHSWSPIAQRLYKRGCPKCFESKGERKIRKILKDAGVHFREQFIFEDLLSEKGYPLRFDFAVIINDKVSRLIEYDGCQHFIPLKFRGGYERFVKDQKRDKLKNDYCKTNCIKLVRVPYTQFSSITYSTLMET